MKRPVSIPLRRLAARLLVGLLALPALAALAGPRDEYAWQWPLTLERDGGGAYRFGLNEGIYRQVQDPALGDLVVIDRNGTAVPASVFPAEAPLAKAPRRVALPWFALPSTPAGSGGAQGWELVSQADADGHLRRVEARITDSAVAALPRSALLVDVSRMREGIAALELQWQPIEALDLGYRVEASGDLEHWTVLATRGRLVDLQREGRRLLHRRIELYGLLPHYQNVRYLRLTPDRHDLPIVITAVDAELASARGAAAPKWVEVTGRRVRAAGGDAFEFEVDGRFPVQQVDVALAGNHAVEWRADSRDDEDADWRPRAGPWVAFRVDAAGDGRSPARELGDVVRDRYWRLRAGTPVSGEPKLRLGYRPEVVVFLAQGAPPYALAAGSASSRRADSPMPQLVAELRRQRGEHWQPSAAFPGAPQVLAGEAVLRARPDWKAWLLWAVLGLGALVVVAFAATLLRGPKPAPSPGAVADAE